MGNSIQVSKSTQTQTGTVLDALQVEGKTLGKMWAKLHDVKQSTQPKGFDTRLGKVLVELKAQSSLDSGQISRQTLINYGVANIDRRRRSEALWFVENEVDCREFIKNSKKGYTSLTALQKAMKDATAKAEVIEDAADKVSNVGQSNGVKDTGWVDVDKGTFSLGNTRTAIVDAIFAHCNDHQIDIDTIITDLQSKAALANKVAA
tara:strand:- start:532 stop:1146 length:615 start_codon:yes stop_codon:yes gene_type:complete